MTVTKRKLGELKKGDRGRIVSVTVSLGYSPSPSGRLGQSGPSGQLGHAGLRERLLEMGLIEGSLVEVAHEAPFGKDPVAVKVRGSLIALRRNEADHVEVVHE